MAVHFSPRAANLLLALVFAGISSVAGALEIYVDPVKGVDDASGSRGQPLQTLAAALGRLPDVVSEVVVIRLAPGRHSRSGMTWGPLDLSHAMRGRGHVRIIGWHLNKPAALGEVVLDWESRFLVVARRGHWTLEHLQVGSNRTGQLGGLDVGGPALVELHDVRIRTRFPGAAGILAHHAGRVHLHGEILLNEHLRFASADHRSFSRIQAEYGGVVRFMQREGASLSLGNGNLSARTYGIIELGCERASITSWNHQSNPIAVNNSGRIELKGTTVHLTAHDRRNTPIGLEHDGHVLAENARIILDGKGNGSGIVLQKASTLYGGTVEIRGEIFEPLRALSGSHLQVAVEGYLGDVVARTGATIVIGSLRGGLLGEVTEEKSGRVILPDDVADELAQRRGSGDQSEER